MGQIYCSIEVGCGLPIYKPLIIQAITNRLHEWKHHRCLYPLSPYPPAIAQAAKAQDRIGWGSFLEGGVSILWSAAQALFLPFTKSPKTSRQWTTALIQKLFNVAWDQWEHRNKYLHDNKNKLDQEEVKQTDAKIRQAFCIGSRLLAPADRGLFKTGRKKILAHLLDSKLDWLRHVQVA